MKHKKTHRILSMLLAVSLAFSMTGGFAFAADEGAGGGGVAIGTSSVEGEAGKPQAPNTPDKTECICPPVDSGEVVHKEDCPLYEAPPLMLAPKAAAITILVNDDTTPYGGADLAAAVTASGVTANTITALKITAGEVTAEDWNYFTGGTPGNTKTRFTALKTFEVADAVTSVADIPNGTGSYPLFHQTITHVTIPQVIVVGNDAFSSCINLTTVSLPKVTTIGEHAFYECNLLSEVDSLSNAITIGKNAFYNCKALTSVSFPVATSIGQTAFFGCVALTNATLPAATSIGVNAFSGCTLLASVSLPAATSIGINAFYECTTLATVTLPAATSVGINAFYGCTALATVTLPAATSIGENAFYDCAALATLKLGAGVPTVTKANAFTNCPSPRNLTLVDADGTTPLTDPTALATAIAAYKAAPDGNTGDNLWWGWTLPAAPELPKITITVNGGTAVGGDSLSDAVGKSGVAATAITALKITAGEVTAEDWKYFAGGTPGITKSPFTALTTFEVADTPAVTKVANIPAWSLYDGDWKAPVFPTTITTVIIPQVIMVGNNAFQGCTALQSVSLPKAATISAGAFNGCTSLASISLPAMTKIGGGAFTGCSKLAELKLGATVPELRNDAFLGCPKTNPLVIVDENGKELTGTDLTKAQKAYDDVVDSFGGNVADDGLWYGWKVREPVAGPVASWAVTGGGTGKGTLAEALAAVKASGGTVTLLDNVDDRMNAINVTISEFSQPVTLVLNGKTLHANVIFEGLRGLFTVDGTAEGSKIQGATGAAIYSDGSNLKLKGGTYIGASEGGETAPAIAMTVAAGDTKEKLKDLLADGYAYESEDGFTVADVDGQSTAITGNAVKVVTATTDPATQILFFKGDGKLYYRTLPDATHPDGTLTEVPAGAVRGWSAEGNVLTLMNFNFTTSAQYGLMISGNATVKLRGQNNSITSTYTSSTANDKSAGIYCLEDDSVKVYFEGTSTLTATGGNLTGNYSNSYGIWSANLYLQFSDCTVKAIGGTAANSYGVYARNFTMKNAAKVTGQTANATTEAYGVYVHTSVFNIGGGGELTGEAGTAAKSQAVRWSHGNPINTAWRFWGGNAYDQPAKASNGNNNNGPYYIALESAPTTVLSKAKITCVEAKWVSADGNTSGEDTLLESLDKVKSTGGTVTLLGTTGFDSDDGIGVNITDAFTAPVTLVLDGNALKGMVNALGNTGLFTIDGSEIDSGIQCTQEAAIVSDGINLKLKGGTYASSAQPSRPAIMMMVEKNEPGEVEKLKTLLADGYAFADESDFAVTEEGRQPVAVTGKTVRVVKSAPVAVTGVSLNKTALSLEAGKNETLTATVAPENATNKAVTWKSSAADVASVDASGKVTALKPGAATITVTTTDGSKTATCAVTVTAVATKPAPGGKLEAPLTQDKVDGVFGEGNATLDNTSTPPKITIDNSITPENPIEIETDVTIDLGGNTITGKPGQPGLVVGDDDKVDITGGGTVSGGDNPGGSGGNGITGGTGSDITIGGGVTVEGGDGTTGGDGINSGGNVNVGGDVNGGNGSNGNGGDGVDTSGGSGDITLKPGGGVSGGDSTGGNGNGGNGTNSGGGTIIGGDVTGGNGNGSGSGGNGATTGSGDTTISGGGSATGGTGGNTSSGTGGNGGNGGNGSISTGGGSIEVGGGSTGGNGGSGATGGTGGNGTSTGGNTTVTGGGTATGGTGGSGSANGGNGGNGANSGSTTINKDGEATGGSGGSGATGSNGNGGNGGNGVHQGVGTVGDNGTATGGNGGSGAGTGSGGNGGAGVGGGAKPGDNLIVQNGISAKVEVVGDAGVKIELPNAKETVDAVLTNEEKADKNITDVKVTLKVDDKTAAKPDKAAIDAAKPTGSIIGAFFDITLKKTITKTGGSPITTDVTGTPNNQMITITIEIPANMQGGSDYVVIRVHNGTGTALSTTQLGNNLTFDTNQFSTYAIAYTKSTTPPPPSDNTGGGGSSSSNDEYDFWMSVKDKINSANSGDVIKVSVKSNDKMPESVMAALRKNSGVTLVISWNGGKTITIPAGKAAKQESGRIYWPLSLLAEIYQGIEYVETPADISKLNPETGGGDYIAYADGKQIPITGGGELITLEAPALAAENNLSDATENAQAIAPVQPKPITPPDAGFEPDAFAGTPDAKQANSGNVFAVIALMLSAVAVGSGVWFWKRRTQTEKQ